MDLELREETCIRKIFGSYCYRSGNKCHGNEKGNLGRRCRMKKQEDLGLNQAYKSMILSKEPVKRLKI